MTHTSIFPDWHFASSFMFTADEPGSARIHTTAVRREEPRASMTSRAAG